MKDWREIPEYKELWDKAMKDFDCLKTLKYDSKNEFDTPEHRHWVKWQPILLKFTLEYKRKHPEEFDENGQFKDDT